MKSPTGRGLGPTVLEQGARNRGKKLFSLKYKGGGPGGVSVVGNKNRWNHQVRISHLYIFFYRWPIFSFLSPLWSWKKGKNSSVSLKQQRFFSNFNIFPFGIFLYNFYNIQYFFVQNLQYINWLKLILKFFICNIVCFIWLPNCIV